MHGRDFLGDENSTRKSRLCVALVWSTRVILGPMRESPMENGGSWPQQELRTARVFRVVLERMEQRNGPTAIVGTGAS